MLHKHISPLTPRVWQRDFLPLLREHCGPADCRSSLRSAGHEEARLAFGGVAGVRRAGASRSTREVAFDDPGLNERYRALIREIRCPKCLNESIAESDAPVAADLRREVRRLIGEGASDDEVKTFLVGALRRVRAVSAAHDANDAGRCGPGRSCSWRSARFVFWRILAARRNQPLDEELPP